MWHCSQHGRKLNWVVFLKNLTSHFKYISRLVLYHWLLLLSAASPVLETAHLTLDTLWRTQQHREALVTALTLCPHSINMVTGRRAENWFIYTDGFRMAGTPCPVPTARVEQWSMCNEGLRAMTFRVWLKKKKKVVFSLKEKKLRYPWELHS